MYQLTRKEQKVLAVTIFLLLTGLAVKTYRIAHSMSGNAATESVAPLRPGQP